MIEVIVTARHALAQAICSFELRRFDGLQLPRFTAGAHIDVHLPDGLVRQYSLCGVPWESERYIIGVLRDEHSCGGSKALHEQVQVGHRLMISEPRNLFPLVDNAKSSLLFAGGIGITPILCMAEQLHLEGANFKLYYFARSADRAAFVERLEASPFAHNVHLYFDNEQSGEIFDVEALLAAPSSDRHLYVCGPKGFIDHIFNSAKAQGWGSACVHYEYFTAHSPCYEEENHFAVHIKSSGQVIHVAPTETVAAALEAAGVFVPISCGQGICGACLTGVLEGEPDHRDQCLSIEERARNDKFTPCCSRAKSASLVLDL